RDLRFGAGSALLAGVAIGFAALATKTALNEVAGGDTGFVLLMAAAVLAAWFGGLIGGMTAVIVTVSFNAVIFLGGDGQAATRTELVRQIIYVVAATGTALLVASRRAARDRLVDALDEVAALAVAVEARDTRLELMLAASGTGFWEWDIDKGRLEWSDAIFRQYGLKPAAHAPPFDAFLDLIHPDDREAFQTAIAAALDGLGPFELDFRIIWPDGSIHWTRGAGRLLSGEVGRPMWMLGTGQDITERRRVEEERDQLLAEERRAGEFREAFIDVISHELRTPITTILGLTQILSRPGRADDATSRLAMLEDVRAESERLHRLVEDLLVLSRAERGRLVIDAEPLQPRRLLERIVTQEAPELPSLQIEMQVAPDLPVVAGDPTYLEQIVRNLLGNAAKYTPVGTRVVVDARHEGDAVEVRVIDEGPGVPDESVRRVFDLFYRDPDSARAVAGSGIGLFVCRSLVEAMGGRMWALRRPEGGSEFGFTLRVLEVDDVDAGDGRPLLSARPARPAVKQEPATAE
ncbi:MAG: PAS domain-containing protein, partial [Chloroflexi bacterium]|nr:PAS domain-containing protein [Chloroflexota bacterium]